MANKTTQAAAPKAKNMGDDPSTILNDGIPNLDNFVEDHVGFAPYLKPSEGMRFYAVLIARDERGEFPRYVLQNLGGPLKCQSGPVDNAEEVIVEQGGKFTFSQYVQLQDAFDFYLTMGAAGSPVPVVVTALEKVKGGQGNVWIFKVQMESKIKQLVAKARTALPSGMATASNGGAAAALPEGN